MSTIEMMEGGCQCGFIRYRVSGKPLRLNVCHCKDCQKQSGSAFGMSLVVRPESLALTAGEVKTFELQAESGRIKVCAFCPKCGVRIYNATAALCSVKAGTLDDTNGLVPDAHYWTSRKQAWAQLPDDLPCFETHEERIDA